MLVPFDGIGQHLNFDHYSRAEGYADQADFNIQIIQDRLGFIWIPTLNGLYRYDGREFRAFRYDPENPNGLNTNTTRTLYEDREGKIWIGTENGINIYDPETGLFEHLSHDPEDPESLCGNNVRFITEDRQGRIWAGVSIKTACFCEWENRRFGKTYTETGDNGFLQHSDGTLWLSNPSGLYKYLSKPDSFLHIRQMDEYGAPITYGASDLFETAQGDIWFNGKRKTKGIFDPRTSTFRDLPSVIHKTPAPYADRAMIQARDGKVWFGGMLGASMYDPRKNTYYVYPHRPEESTSPQKEITSIFEDRAGSIWFSSYGGGGLSVAHSPDNPFEALETPPAEQFLFLDQRHLLLIDPFNKKTVFDIVNNRPASYALPAIFAGAQIGWMTLAEDNMLWWVVPFKAHGFNLTTGASIVLDDKKVIALAFDKDGNPCFRDGSRYDRAKGQYVEIKDKIQNLDPSEQRKQEIYNKVLIDNKDRVWLGGTTLGLVRHDPKTDEIRFFRPDPKDPNSVIKGTVILLFEASNGRIYILTANGMSVYEEENDRFVQIGLAEGLPQTNNLPVIEDHQKNIWLGMGDGLVKINGHDMAIQKFDEGDGLPAGRFAEYFAKDPQGRIYFAKNGKMYRFQPERLQTDTTAFSIIITDFFLNHEKINPGEPGTPIDKNIHYQKKLELKHTQSDFGFRFVSPDFKKAERLEYHYQLENYDRDWVNIGAKIEAHFTNIPPGTYRFKVKARTPAGTWTPEYNGLQIRVLPAWWETWWFFCLCVFTIVALVFTWIYRLRTEVKKATKKIRKDKETIERQAEQLKELDKAKSDFFTNISHEFRTPLTIISGMVDQVQSKPDQWLEKGAKIIKQNTLNLLNLINQILDLRKLESKDLKLNLMQGDIVRYLRYLKDSYHSYAENEGLQLHFLAARPSIIMDYDPDKILRIVSNLLSNAIKYNEPGGNIYFYIDQIMKEDKSKWLTMRVQDTGAGIPPEKLANIFDRFYQVNEPGERNVIGSGIGLALTHELVRLMNGTIEVQSELGVGTTFTIQLPITRISKVWDVLFSPEDTGLDQELLASSLMEEQIDSADASGKKSADLASILIVEDNPQIVQILIACLEDKYQLEIAGNGREGIEKAIEQTPDVIISDVMMPEKDGFELTATLKNDERTNHIPIILLTAKSDVDSRIRGLEKGADAYLAKPFEQRELLIRLEKLLELRKKLQEKYARSAVENGGKTIEDPFLQKVYACVEKELSNPDLDMNDLCRALAMSRSQIFRKMKALTGQATSLYIRRIRLNKAKELLETTDLNISQIAYEVGFNYPNYFSKAFFEEFGVHPNETRK
jgi:signal transduction histidine kinase/DNA-binding response OmpR family regulator/ligand-binding sensor domain-containing protein